MRSVRTNILPHRSTLPGHGRTALALLTALAAAFLTIPAASASAALVTVDLDGPGTGTVTSSPPGINCSNVAGGSPGPSCSADFSTLTNLRLTATPEAGLFAGWSGGAGTGTCASGSTNPCNFFVIGAASVTATFDPPPDPPVATTDPATDIGFFRATLHGRVNPGGSEVEECFFEYGPTTEYGETAPCDPPASGLGNGTDEVEVSAELAPLEPDTTYHFRLVAENAGGPGRGDDRTLTTAPAPPDDCPNADIRAAQGINAILLPDCMALEMVSPPEKASQTALFPNVSVDGERVSFSSRAVLGENPQGGLGPNGQAYVATRSDSGWATETTIPDVGLRTAWRVAASLTPESNFTPDFSHWLGIGATSEQLEQGIARAYDAGLGGFFRWLSAPLVPLSFDESNVTGRRGIVIQSSFEAASADHSHLYFSPGAGGSRPTTYLPGDPELRGPGSEADKVYLVRLDAAGQRSLELLQRDRTGKVWGGSCGARLGGIGAARNTGDPAPNGDRNQGAVSPDGRLTYFSARASQPESGDCDPLNKLRIFQRLETAAGPKITPLFSSECSRPALPDPPGPCSDVDGDDLYQGASLDQTKVYLTTNRQLADSDTDGSSAQCHQHLFGQPVAVAVAGCDLYLYDATRPAGERLIQVSAGEDVPGQHEAGSGAKVYNAITAISADGSHAYFVAEGVLTADQSPEGETATEGEPNLYLWDQQAWEDGGEQGGLSFIGRLDPDDGIRLSPGYEDGLWGGQGTWRNNAYPVPVTGENGEGDPIGGDGHVLVFESHAALAPNDADGTHLDVYRYDSEAETLRCVSCAPGSSAADPDTAPFDVADRGRFGALGTDFAEWQRWVSEDGDRIVFETEQALLPGEVNGTRSAYLWRDGELHRLPGRGLGSGGSPPVLSHDGSTVGFATRRALLPQDGDTTTDVYVARSGGGFPPPVQPPPPCEGDACQGDAPPAPQAERFGSSQFTGPGNPSAQVPDCSNERQRVKRSKRKVKRAKRAVRRAKANRREAKATKRLRKAKKHVRKAKKHMKQTKKRLKRCNRGGQS